MKMIEKLKDTMLIFVRKRIRLNNLPLSPAFNPPGDFGSRSYGIALNSPGNEKIVVFGLPKSGNVWLVSLLADYLGLAVIDPYVDINLKGVGMCHRPYASDVFDRQDFTHGVYLIRDLRDVIVSYYHHTQREDWRRGFPHFHCDTIEQFYFEWFLPRVTIAQKIDDHARNYTSAGLPVVRYEALYKNPEKEFCRLIKRLGFPVDLERMARVVVANELSKLQKSGKKQNVYVPNEHFRKGGHGGFREELPQVVLRHVNRRFGNLLEEWGYEL